MYGYRCNMHIRNTVVCDASKGSLIRKPPNAFPLTEFFGCFFFWLVFFFFFFGGGGGGVGSRYILSVCYSFSKGAHRRENDVMKPKVSEKITTHCTSKSADRSTN